MLGAIAGDVIGSVFERNNVKTTEFPLFCEKSKFTDDTVLTIAVADSILNKKTYTTVFIEYAANYPKAGFGKGFKQWLNSPNFEPFSNAGNGTAMRVSPVGFAFDTLDKVMDESKKSAATTITHPEGVKGAQSVASSIFLARQGKSKVEIKEFIEKTFGYNLSRTLDEIRPTYTFDVTCQGSVPIAIISFLESDSYEDAVRKAISVGGDSDTIACIAGGIAQACYKNIPSEIVENIKTRLPNNFWATIEKFNQVYNIKF